MATSSQNATERGTILLFGLPRSGTTWIGKIFDSHPSTLYRHEPDSWKKIDDVPIFPEDSQDPKLIEVIRQFHEMIPRISAEKVCAKAPIFSKTYLSTGGLALYRLGSANSKILARVGIALPVLGVPRATGSSVRLVWKSIESIGRLGLVLNALQDAHGILILRHPCGYVASVLSGEASRRFEDNSGASEDYEVLRTLMHTKLARERKLSLEHLKEITAEERLAWRWVLSNAKALEESSQTGRCTILRYEDMCRNPVAIAKTLFAKTGLQWSAQTEKFISRSTSSHAESYYGVYKNPIVAAEKWRNQLESAVVDRILDVVRDTPPGRAFFDPDRAAEL